MKSESEKAKRRLATIHARYGENYYRELGKRFAQEKLEADPAYYARIGEQGGLIGGNVTFARHGHEHFVGLGQKSVQKRKEASR